MIKARKYAFPLAACGLALLLGCQQGRAPQPEAREAAFDARHELRIAVPPGAQNVRVWMTIPQDDPLQEVLDFEVESPFPHRIERDASGDNAFLYLEASNPQTSEITLVNRFRLARREQRTVPDPTLTRPLIDDERREFATDLEANTHVIIDDRIRALSREIVGDEQNPILAARRLYDWMLDFADYWVKDPSTMSASPVGSTEFCLTTSTGNCTDIHSLWASLARAAGIPTRIVYGSFFKRELDGEDIDQSYHCWMEFYAPDIGWIPHDVALAELFTEDIPLTPANTTLVQRTTPSGYFGRDDETVEYYFGNIDERRVTWSLGRDLTLSPRQQGGPVNAMAKAYVEIDGRPVAEGADGWTRKLTFVELSDAQTSR